MVLPTSIKYRFSIVIVATLTLLLILFGYVNYASIKSDLLASLHSQTDRMLKRLEKNLPSAVWNFEQEFMEAAIESEMGVPFVIGITVRNEEETFATKGQKGKKIINLTSPPKPEEYTELIKRPLVFEEDGEKNTVGFVDVYVDHSVINKRLNDVLMQTAVGVVLLDIIINILLLIILDRIVLRSISQLTSTVEDIAEGEGDLRQRLDTSEGNEISLLSAGFNKFIGRLQDIVSTIRQASDHLNQQARDTSATLVQANAGLNEKQGQIRQIAASTSQMSVSINEIAEHAEMASQSADEATSRAQDGHMVIVESVANIHSLAEELEMVQKAAEHLIQESEKIGAVLDVIIGISQQTNLLALNAAIEAARAGEAGRGFAVVADEVRTLAMRTNESTDEIQESIDSLHRANQTVVDGIGRLGSQVDTSVQKINSAGTSIETILNGIEQIRAMNGQIAATTEEQSKSVYSINETISQISTGIEDTVGLAENSINKSKELEALSQDVQRLLQQFKT